MSNLNVRLRELGATTPYGYDDWVAAVMYLGDKAEGLLAAVEALVATGLWSPISAAMSTELVADDAPRRTVPRPGDPAAANDEES